MFLISFKGCSSKDRDSDDDGLDDGFEVNVLGTLPNNIDSDGDGILDGTEYGLIADEVQIGYWMSDTYTYISGTDMGVFVPDSDPSTTTDPTDTDTDKDGLDDGVEDIDKNGRVSVSDYSESDPSNPDTDGDMIIDGEDPGIRDCDYDDDGLWDGPSIGIYFGELAYGTDNTKWDSEDTPDGLPDGLEVGLDLSSVKTGSAAYRGYNVMYTNYNVNDAYATTGYFWPDADDTTTTKPLIRDSDDDGLTDGQEDFRVF